MKHLLRLSAALALTTAALSSCQTDTTDRNVYKTDTPNSPGVRTQAETDRLSPNIDLPPDSINNPAPADTMPR